MRILIVTPMLPYPRALNAGPQVTYAALSELGARHDLTLATFAGPNPAERAAITALRGEGITVQSVWRPAYTGLQRWRRRAEVFGFAAHGYYDWLRGAYPRLVLRLREPEMQDVLDRLFADHSFDLLQIEDSLMASYRYPSGLPTVLIEHEVRPSAPGAHPPHTASRLQRALDEKERVRWQRYQQTIWRRVDRIQVFTERDAAAVRTLAPDVADRTRINPFGVTPSIPTGDTYEQPETVVFVGGFIHPPNVDAALWLGREIMPLLRARRPGVRLLIVGNDPPREVRALDGRDIIVTGRVPDVAPFLARAAVVLAPLRMGGGMRLKVLQAMALGKAVVATPLGAEGIVTAGGAPPLVVAEDAVAIADAVADLLASEATRRALGERARAHIAAHHTWPAYAQRLEAIYRELVSPERLEPA